MQRLILAAVFTAISVAFSASAHEGHDHDAPPALAPEAASPRAVATSDTLELVAISRGDRLIIYLDRFATNEPVVDASVEVDAPGGLTKAEPRDGAYEIAAPWAAAPGAYDLLFTVATAEGADVFTTVLNVPAPQSAAPARTAPATAPAISFQDNRALPLGAGVFLLGMLTMVLLQRGRRGAAALVMAALAAGMFYVSGAAAAGAGDVARRLQDGAIFVPKPTQRLLDMRTVQVRAGQYPKTVELPGRVIPDPNASGYVQAAVSGRLSPPQGGFPRLGRTVRRGDVLAYVAPPLTAAETSDQRQRQGELDQQIQIVERRVERFERLVASGSASKVQLEEARLELQGLRDRRASLDRGPRQLEELVAPVDGVIAAVNAVAGQIAETNAIVFQIADPNRLWIEALSFEALHGVSQAAARSPQGDRFDLEFIGSGLSDRMQSVPAHFAVLEASGKLRAGQLVTVTIASGDSVTGVAAPRSAVVDGPNGQTIVYEHTQPERFEPRPVRIAPLDGDRVLIQSGLATGARIVMQGAELLNQVR